MATSILWEPRLIVCHADGRLTIDSVNSLRSAAFDDPRYSDIDALLLDFSDVRSTTISSSDVSIFASADHLYAQLEHPRRMAILCPSNSKLRQLAEQYRREVSDRPLAIAFFKDKAAARDWLSAAYSEDRVFS